MMKNKIKTLFIPLLLIPFMGNTAEFSLFNQHYFIEIDDGIHTELCVMKNKDVDFKKAKKEDVFCLTSRMKVKEAYDGLVEYNKKLREISFDKDAMARYEKKVQKEIKAGSFMKNDDGSLSVTLDIDGIFNYPIRLNKDNKPLFNVKEMEFAIEELIKRNERVIDLLENIESEELASISDNSDVAERSLYAELASIVVFYKGIFANLNKSEKNQGEK
jgi:hypothetical protein